MPSPSSSPRRPSAGIGLVLFVFVVLAHDRRRVVHVNVTDAPTAQWTGQQLVEAFPWDTAPRLARPGGNITGLTFLAPALVAKRLQLLKEAVPGVSHLAALLHPGVYGEHTMRDMLKETEIAAQTLGVQLQVLEARSPEDFDTAFSAMVTHSASALIVSPSPMFYGAHRRLVDLAAKHRLPTMYAFKEAVAAGGLMSYGTSIPDLSRRAATYVDKILKGAKPADLPVEQPTVFEFVINLKTAKALGLTIPPAVLGRADQVLE